MLEVGQKVVFVREKPPGHYKFDIPEEAVVTKIGKINFCVRVTITQATHTFRIETLEDVLYTNHKLFLTEIDYLKEKKERQRWKGLQTANQAEGSYFLEEYDARYIL